MEVTRTFDLIQWNLEKYPREVMYGGKTDKEWITYSTEDVSNYVNWVSYGFLALGLKRGDKVATISGNKPEWNFVDMALAQTGLIHVPIYPTIGTDEYEYILKHSEVRLIIVGNKTIYAKVSPVADKIAGLKEIYSFDAVEGVRSFNEIIEEGKRNAASLHDELQKIKNSIRPEDLVTIIYTYATPASIIFAGTA